MGEETTNVFHVLEDLDRRDQPKPLNSKTKIDSIQIRSLNPYPLRLELRHICIDATQSTIPASRQPLQPRACPTAQVQNRCVVADAAARIENVSQRLMETRYGELSEAHGGSRVKGSSPPKTVALTS